MHPYADHIRIPAPWSLTHDALVPALLVLGDALVVVGHAVGRVADRLAPMGDSGGPDEPVRVEGRAR